MKKFFIILSLFAASIFAVNYFVLNDEPPAALSDPAEPYEPGGVPGYILDFVVHIFIPREQFWQDKFDSLSEVLRDRLPYQVYVDSIGRLREISDGLDGEFGIPSIIDDTDELYSFRNVLNMISPYMQPFRIVITGLYIIFIAYYNYRQILFLIRGTNYAGINDTLRRAGE